MNYREYKKQRQDEFDNLPIFFAFGREQFKKAMEERGLTENDVDKIYQLGSGFGGYYLKKDAQVIRDFYNKPDKLSELMKDHDFAVDAFYDELWNHEYEYNVYQGDWDVCSCFGSCEYGSSKDYRDYLKELGYPEECAKWYAEAKKKYYKVLDERGF